jgi:predicted Zn-dependent protease
VAGGSGCQDAVAQATGVAADARRAPRLVAVALRLLRRPGLWVAAVLLGLAAGGLTWAWPHLRAAYHFRAARSELQRYHNPQAIRHVQVCLRDWPGDPDVLLLAARAARRARGYAEAERLLEQYQRARGLDEAGSLEQLLLSVERRVDQMAEVCWRYVEGGHPDTPLILEALTRGYLRQYRLVEARRCLDHWLERQPDNPQALCLDGLFHLDYEHARSAGEASFRRAVELDPDNEEARQGLAVALLDGSQPADAAEHLEYVRQRQPDNLSAQVGLAECRDALGDPAEAARLVDAVLARHPEFAPALSLRGRLALQAGQPAEAEPWLREAVARSPSDHRALYNLVRCLRENGKDEEAGRRQQELDQREKDLKRYDEIVRQEMVERPRDPALHCALGELLLRGGYRREGLYWLQSALRIDPNYAPARRALADHYQKAKAEQQSPDSGE